MTKKLKIIGIGNSIVNGFPHRRSQCFMSLLRERTGHEIINKGVNGDTTQGVLERYEKDFLSHKPDIGILMTGGNDMIHQLASPAKAVSLLMEIDNQAKEIGSRMLLLTPLLCRVDMAERMWMPGAGLDYRRVNKELVEMGQLMMDLHRKGLAEVLDLQSAYLEFVDKNGPEQAFTDGLHPSLSGHMFIADFLEAWIGEDNK